MCADKDKRPEHSVETDKHRKGPAADEHEVDAPAERVDDESSDKTTTRQE